MRKGKMNKKFEYYLMEHVVYGPTGKFSAPMMYSLPDLIENPEDIKELIKTIEDKNNEYLFRIITGNNSNEDIHVRQGEDLIKKKNITSNAAIVWDHLKDTEIGKKLIGMYPNITNYRICAISSRNRGDEEEFEEFDEIANKNLDKFKNGTMPSFREFWGSWNEIARAGAAPKESTL